MSGLLHLLSHPTVVAVSVALSVSVLALGAFSVPMIIARLPDDYFVRERPRVRRHPLLRLLLDGLLSVLGALLVLVGLAMLVLPGQGILTIVAGLSLMRFPGKRKLQRMLLRLPGVRRVVSAIRRRANESPLLLDEPQR